MTDEIYHYTSIKALYSILDSLDDKKNVYLRLNSISNMNDKFEGVTGLEIDQPH